MESTISETKNRKDAEKGKSIEGTVDPRIRQPTYWDAVDADGNVDHLGQGPAVERCLRLGTAQYVNYPAGTQTMLERLKAHDAKNSDAVHATLRVLNEGIQSRHDKPPKFLIMYGSLRDASTAQSLAIEVSRILHKYGADVKIFDPHGLPLYNEDLDPTSNSKCTELHTLVHWCEGMVWVSPEYHGTISGVLKNQIDWMPLTVGAIRPTQGKTLAVMQVEGGSQTFNTVLAMRSLGRWMRLVCIPNQVSIPRAQLFFDENRKMFDSSFRARVVDVCDELYKFTLLLRGQNEYFTTRYSESRKGYRTIEGAQANPGAG